MSRELAHLTADVVAIAPGPEATPLVLLIRRRHDPYAGCWSLPGGHVDPGETAEAAARRELAEETGVEVALADELGVWHQPGRDPRGRYVTVAHLVVLREMPVATAGDDATEAEWVPARVALDRELAFDHREILIEALREIGEIGG